MEEIPNPIAKQHNLVNKRNLIIALLFTSAIIISTLLLVLVKYSSTVKIAALPAKIYQLKAPQPSFIDSSIMEFSPDRTIAAKLFWKGNGFNNHPTDTIIQLINLEDGSVKNSLNWSNSIYQLKFSPDGSLLASANKTDVQIWRVSDGAILFNTNSFEYAIDKLQFSPDNKWLAVVTSHDVSLVNVTGTIVVHTINTEVDPNARVAFSPDGEILATKNTQDIFVFWSTNNGQKIRELPSVMKFSSYMLFSNNGDYFINIDMYADDSFINFWRVKDGQLVSRSKTSVSVCHGMMLSPSGKLLAVYGQKGMELWQIDNGRHLRSLKIGVIESIHEGPSIYVSLFRNPCPNFTTAIAFSPDEKLIAALGSSSGYEQMRIWQVEDGQLLSSFHFETKYGEKLCFNPIGNKLITDTVTNNLTSLNIESLLKSE